MIPKSLKDPYAITGTIVAILGILSTSWIPEYWYLTGLAIASGCMLLIMSQFIIIQKPCGDEVKGRYNDT